MSSLTVSGNGLLLRTPYSPGLVADLKAQVPASGRTWDGASKAWLLAPQYGQVAAKLVETYFSEALTVPIVSTAAALETRMLDVRYVGLAKERGNGETSAFGWANGGWSVILPEAVLRGWFCQEATPEDARTLYAVLGIPATSGEPEIKTAYRRMARQWHPDTCREPNAADVFRTIQHAWEVLSNAKQRRRYDAGLSLFNSLKQKERETDKFMTAGYRAPLRCGLILAEGHAQLARFLVTKLLLWEDITDAVGRVLTTSWPAGADNFVEQWV